MTPGDLPDVYEVAWRVGSVFESLSIPYFLGGSLASSLQGESRATNDLDFVIDLPIKRIPELARALGPDFEVDQEALADAVRRRRSWNIYFLPSVYKVDLFQKGAGPYDDVEFQRRRPFDLGDGRSVFVKSPEDSVLRKLWWFRQGGEVSSQQWRDIVQLLRANPKLDDAYIDEWSVKLGVGDLLQRARSEGSAI